MKSRWLSTFTLIGVLLVILGIVGLVLQHAGSGFVFDPGQPPAVDGQDHTALYYLVIGALMVLNGLVLPALTPAEVAEKNQADRAVTRSNSVSSSLPSASREVVTTTANEPGE